MNLLTPSTAPNAPMRPMTVRVSTQKARFQFNNSAACWFAARAITRISISVDPVLKSVTIHTAPPQTKSIALSFRYLPGQSTPDRAAFYSKFLLAIFHYEHRANATFLCVPREDSLSFLLDPEYELREAINIERSSLPNTTPLG